MNENLAASLFDSSDDDVLARTIDRFADGECSADEAGDLFDRLDATPGAWKRCALALAEARDLRTALAGAGRRVSLESSIAFRAASQSTGECTVAPDPSLDEAGRPRTSPRRQTVAWLAVALGLAVAFAAGSALAPWQKSANPTLTRGGFSGQSDGDAAQNRERDRGQDAKDEEGDLIAYDGTQADAATGRGPEIVDVVYRPSGDGEETSAPLPMYRSDEDWARVLDDAVRHSEADLAERRAQLLLQGADLERQIVLHPVSTDRGEMLLPVETFQIVPVTLNSFH